MAGILARAGRAGLATGIGAGVAAAAWGVTETRLFALRRRAILIGGTDAFLIGGTDQEGGQPERRCDDPRGYRPGRQIGPSMRVLHLSDLHLTARQHRKIDWIANLADHDPDLVVCTGDMIAQPEALAPLLSALSPLARTPGVFVFGSNDYYYPKLKNPFRYFARDTAPRAGELEARPQLPWREMAAAFEQAGWLNLSNARGSLRIDGWNLDFVGVDDPHLGYDRFPEGRGDCADETGAARKATDVRIGVAHAPYARVLDAMVDDGCSIVFAGHTHGGQVCLPGKGALVTNCDMPVELAAGLFEWPGPSEVIRYDGFAPTLPDRGRRAWVNISAGLGTSPLAPVRVACRPEAVLLDLVVI